MCLRDATIANLAIPARFRRRIAADIMFSGVLAPSLLTIEAVSVDGTMVV